MIRDEIQKIINRHPLTWKKILQAHCMSNHHRRNGHRDIICPHCADNKTEQLIQHFIKELQGILDANQ